MFNKGGNIIFEQMKIFKIRENKPQQILILPMKAIKGLQNNGTIWTVKHVFVWCIIYEQHVASVNVRISRKKNVKVIVENWLVRFIRKELQILHVKLLIKHFGSMYRDLCFVSDLIQIIIKYCDIRLHTKYTPGIEQGISPRIFLIQDGKWPSNGLI